eukprot:12052124-Karenia_brevis.AAC.1
MQPMPTRWDKGRGMMARLDRIYASCWIAHSPEQTDRIGVSDHCLLHWSIASRRPKKSSQQPINRE